MPKASIMNNTKWNELRLGMYDLGELSPVWKTKDIETGYISEWDRCWFYHFRIGGYKTIEWVEIKIENEPQRAAVINVLKEYYIPYEKSDLGYKIYGYIV